MWVGEGHALGRSDRSSAEDRAESTADSECFAARVDRSTDVNREREKRIRGALLDVLEDGRPLSRSELVRRASRMLDMPPDKRSTRTLLFRQMRRLEEEGLVTDGGPSVWLAGRENRGD